ncbi:MAG: SGNH/GDSL hydrolase family protein [Candidatus Omnitrophica bacterium]|nr:SGNH/GDSL hydrolase family protein [Candidatus Omnitrophota bacterium]
MRKINIVFLLLISLSFIVPLLIFDRMHFLGIASRNWHDPNTRFDSEIGWSPIPNRHVNQAWGDISSNSLGFRSEEIDQSKKQIIILGDSVAWGFGVGDKETMPYYLNYKLEPFDYQVSNLAVSGYSIDQYYIYLKRHIGKFKKLKYVILIIYTGNDFNETIRNVAYGKRKPLFVMRGKQLVLTNVPISRFDLRNLFSTSRILTILSSKSWRINKFFNSIARQRVLDASVGQDVVSLLLEKIYETVSEHNAKLVVVISPSKRDFNEKTNDLLWFQDFFLKRNSRYFCIDYFTILGGYPNDLDRIYIDKGHFSNFGNELLAENIIKNVDFK